MSRTPHFCVIGGGVAGLVTTYLLRCGLPQAALTLVEGSSRWGGWVQTEMKGSFLFEQGPRFFTLTKGGRELLGLLKMLGAGMLVIPGSSKSKGNDRFLHINGKIRRVPSRLDLLRYGPALLREMFVPPGNAEDESVYDFAVRRVGRRTTDDLIVPYCRALLGGDARQMSTRSHFPRLWFLERRRGSLMRALLFPRRGDFVYASKDSWLDIPPWDPLNQAVQYEGGRTFTLHEGCEALIRVLVQALKEADGYRGTPTITPTTTDAPTPFLELRTDARVAAMRPTGEKVEVSFADSSGGPPILADHVIAAIPPDDLAAVLRHSQFDGVIADGDGTTVCGLLDSFVAAHESAVVVNLGYNKPVLDKRFRGLGYACPPSVHPHLLGVFWDSNIFPNLNVTKMMTRIGVWLRVRRGSEAGDGEVGGGGGGGGVSSIEDGVREAVKVCRSHLRIDTLPDETSARWCEKAFPIYPVGFHERLIALHRHRAQHMPWLDVAGTSYHGATIADTVSDARVLTDTLIRRYGDFPVVDEETEGDWMARGYLGLTIDPLSVLESFRAQAQQDRQRADRP
ncbi:unnamed protein product [Vitrella brassicaformis CCMP3155]|uniref:Protoporphyrinogen oxidase n=2 Tax=Vitrella brassicaformis TaxID=1169539 RepID=A0A0G4EMI4_VITBC|nr:unnamed protein product [Vitrella brassicaformis CCMP3155]|mmetsp:Transcript_9215/g.26554  ORF Transcript_9215/g.26554 Transcript_9215/m.26554 type:complete len:567 (-) Transcript_9215:1148-2848(-)|eukprot:CEL98384.1 unnamed protein product [Vitrella brassicaformis CCMP3155]